jgi:putative hydrolase of the HAD superfamily
MIKCERMKYKAVIFDLFGTLVPSLSLEEYRNAMRQIATVLSVSPEDLSSMWMSTARQRETGEFSTKEDNFEYICRELQVCIDNEKIKRAAQISSMFTKNLFKPRSNTIEVITEIKSRGYKTGLITNCASDVPAFWEGTNFPTLFNVTLFSSVVGLAKPDPVIYRLMLERLNVEPDDCLYIGDGSSHELEGASQVGMKAILIQIPDREANNPYRNTSGEWTGPSIKSLSEVLNLLD